MFKGNPSQTMGVNRQVLNDTPASKLHPLKVQTKVTAVVIGRFWVPILVLSQTQCGRKEMFYLMIRSTHFIYGYMALDIW